MRTLLWFLRDWNWIREKDRPVEMRIASHEPKPLPVWGYPHRVCLGLSPSLDEWEEVLETRGGLWRERQALRYRAASLGSLGSACHSEHVEIE